MSRIKWIGMEIKQGSRSAPFFKVMSFSTVCNMPGLTISVNPSSNKSL